MRFKDSCDRMQYRDINDTQLHKPHNFVPCSYRSRKIALQPTNVFAPKGSIKPLETVET